MMLREFLDGVFTTEYLIMDDNGVIESHRDPTEAEEAFNNYGAGEEPADQDTWSGDLLLVEVLARRH